jgi:pilus assembly protein FimV
MKRRMLPAGQAIGTHPSTGRLRWRASAAAVAAAVLLGAYATDASALALGRITVQSALGEPLSAQIDIPEINADEIASLRAVVASPEAFKAAGLDYNAALADVKITLEKRPDGSYFLRLKSGRAVNEPFMDLILESSWASGRVVRDYTMLFDPPAMRQSQQPITAQVTPAPAAPAQPQKPAARTPSTTRAPAAAAAAPGGEGKQVTVKSGDTAGKIASANKPPAVSLDQMLVAMLRANPDAFTSGNVNRLRAGAVLDMPSQEQAALIPPEDARQTLVAQSRDFNAFRRRLAETVPSTKVAAAERQSSGKVTAQVEEKKPSAASPDKLTLSKANAQGKASPTEDKIAKQHAAQDTATRVAELSKNIGDLNKLGKPAAPATPPAASAAKQGIPVPIGAPANVAKPAPAPAPAAVVVAPPAPSAPAATPMVAAASAPATATAASAAAPMASTPVAAASSVAPKSSVPVAAAAKPVTKPTAKPAPAETSFLDDILDNPLILAGAGLIVALIAGFGFYRIQQRRKTAQVDSSFLESRLQPDSFFGASGGQRIDTNEGATGSSMVYSPSQLDAAGDVDPVAEADVYLAYGRDLQAEEILKEALRTQPQRVAIHTKLLEIYAKRRDAKAFELVATEAYGLTHGEGPEWERICELGQELDTSNSLYRPGGQPSDGAAAAVAAAATSSGKFGQTMQTQVIAPPEAAAANPDLDLDLDFSLDEPAAAGPVAAPAAARVAAASPGSYERTQAVDAAATPPMPSLDMDFGAPGAAPAPAPAAASATLDAPDLVLDENSLNSGLNLDATLPAGAMSAAPPPAPAPASKDGMLEFDLGGLSLDLDKPAAKAAPAPAAAAPANGPDTESPTTAGSPLSTAGFEDSSGDPLATKLALAQEFNAIGDPDGARSLAQEVIAEASGDLKTKAQKFLAEIG